MSALLPNKVAQSQYWTGCYQNWYQTAMILHKLVIFSTIVRNEELQYLSPTDGT